MIDVDYSQMPPFLKGNFSNTDVDAALSWAAGAVEAYCERDFSYKANDVILVDPFPVRRSAQLPNPPVVSVTSVEAYMRNETGALSWQPLTNWAWTDEGLLYDTTGLPGTNVSQLPSWPTAPKSLRVTYTHGFAEVPQPVVDAVVKMAAGYLTNPFMMNSRKVGDVESSWSVEMMRAGVNGLDSHLLAPYRLITIAR